jgi:TRAP-type C4-dicarboxylate transport system permease small subunit
MLDRWARTSVRGLELIVATLLAVMTVVIVLQVFFRYVLNSPLTWAEELARLSMIWLAFLGASVALWRRRHIKIEGLEGFLSPWMVLLIRRIIDFMMVVLLLVLSVQSWRLVLSTRRQMTAALQLPVSYAYYAAILAGMVLMTFYQLILVFGGRAEAKNTSDDSSGRSR